MLFLVVGQEWLARFRMLEADTQERRGGTCREDTQVSKEVTGSNSSGGASQLNQIDLKPSKRKV